MVRRPYANITDERHAMSETLLRFSSTKLSARTKDEPYFFIVFSPSGQGKKFPVVREIPCVQTCFGVTSAAGTLRFCHRPATGQGNNREAPFVEARRRASDAGIELAIS